MDVDDDITFNFNRSQRPQEGNLYCLIIVLFQIRCLTCRGSELVFLKDSVKAFCFTINTVKHLVGIYFCGFTP